MSTPTVASTPAPTEKTSVWEDFVDIFYAPASVFRRREEGSWLLPMAVVTVALVVIGLLTYGVMRPVYDAMFDKVAEKMRQNPQVTEDLIEKSRSFGEVTTKYGIVIVIPITIFVTAFLAWLLGKLVDSRQTLHAALVVTAYAYVPRVIGAIAGGVMAMLTDASKLTHVARVTLSPALFVDPDRVSPVLLALLLRLDVFILWTTVLIAIGIAVTGRVSRQRGAVAATLLWLLGTASAVLTALRQ